jgi:hypothetical protein
VIRCVALFIASSISYVCELAELLALSINLFKAFFAHNTIAIIEIEGLSITHCITSSITQVLRLADMSAVSLYLFPARVASHTVA